MKLFVNVFHQDEAREINPGKRWHLDKESAEAECKKFLVDFGSPGIRTFQIDVPTDAERLAVFLNAITEPEESLIQALLRGAREGDSRAHTWEKRQRGLSIPQRVELLTAALDSRMTAGDKDASAHIVAIAGMRVTDEGCADETPLEAATNFLIGDGMDHEAVIEHYLRRDLGNLWTYARTEK